MQVTVYTVAWNEERILQKMIDFYRSRFAGCTIVVYDNDSTDNTKLIAYNNGCVVKRLETNDKFSDIYLIAVKNNAWKYAATDWVIVCDVDEWFDILPSDLMGDDTVLRFEPYTMTSETHGVKEPCIGKCGVFNKRFITDIDYAIGAHVANPKGVVKFSKNTYRMYHYKMFSLPYILQRYKQCAERLCQQNLENKWSYHYKFSQWRIKLSFFLYQKLSLLIIAPRSFLNISHQSDKLLFSPFIVIIILVLLFLHCSF